tara:strand:+ start:2542 stop:2697 length:156 start_codon:yes stop_codon:yes gene_type:complete
MLFLSISDFFNSISQVLLQAFELSITFIALYGIIFLLLSTAENKKVLQRQK